MNYKRTYHFTNEACKKFQAMVAANAYMEAIKSGQSSPVRDIEQAIIESHARSERFWQFLEDEACVLDCEKVILSSTGLSAKIFTFN